MNEEKSILFGRRLVLLSISVVAALAIPCMTTYFLDETSTEHVANAQMPPATGSDNFRPRQVVKRFDPITEFPIVAVRDVADKLNPTELVLGVTVGKQSRAYPINMLTGPSREILNDTLDGHAIAATW